MNPTSPDFQIVEFDLLGVSYIYEGSSRSVMVTGGDENFSLKSDIDEGLRRGLTQHIPAADQIVSALLSAGIPLGSIPIIRYAEEQPTESIPEGAIS